MYAGVLYYTDILVVIIYIYIFYIIFNITVVSICRRFTLHVVTGVEYLHSKGIVHRDIKGANILVSGNGVAKLADFGCSKQLAGMCTASIEESLRAIRGSVPWMAPEVIKQSGHGRSSDIWSIGATVIEMGTMSLYLLFLLYYYCTVVCILYT